MLGLFLLAPSSLSHDIV